MTSSLRLNYSYIRNNTLLHNKAKWSRETPLSYQDPTMYIIKIILLTSKIFKLILPSVLNQIVI